MSSTNYQGYSNDSREPSYFFKTIGRKKEYMKYLKVYFTEIDKDIPRLGQTYYPKFHYIQKYISF